MANNKKNLDDLNKGVKKLNQSSKERKKSLEEENYLLKKQLEYQSESFSLSSQYVDSLKETLGLQSKSSTFQQGFLKVNKEINKAILDQKAGITGVKSLEKQILKNKNLIQKSQVAQIDLQKKLMDGEGKKIGYAKASLTSIEKLHNKLEHSVDLTDEEAASIINQIAKREKTLSQQINGLSNSGKQLLFAQKNTKELEKQNAKRQKELKLAKEIEGKLGVAGKLSKVLGSIPGLGGAAASALKEVTEEMEAAVEAGEKLPTKGQVAIKMFKKMGKSAMKGLVDPTTLAIAAIAQFVKAFKAVDAEAGKLAKNMGISYQEALKFGGEMNSIAATSSDMAVTQQSLMKAQSSLNEYFGVGAKFSGEIAEEFASIQKRTGLSEKAMGFFTKYAMKGGKDTKAVLLNVHKTTLEMNRQNKMSLSNKQVQEDIAKLSSSIELYAKGNVGELTKAVFTSKKLGASMATIESIASGLLDFESSIQAELEAELLLGKDINLEKARQFALEGDMVGVGEEVLKNKAIMNAFETKNVIAQEAAAKALNMSRGDLANMVKEQQNLATLQKAYGDGVTDMASAQKEYNDLRAGGMSAEEAGAKVGDESLANQLESVSAAEKMENVMARIQQIFMAIVEPVMAIVTPIIELLAPALQLIGGIVTGILDGFTWINEALGTSIPLMVTLGTLAYAIWAHNNKTLVLRTAIIAKQKALNFLEFLGFGTQKKKNKSEKKGLLAGIADMAMTAFESVAKIPFIGPILGIAAAASALALGYSYYNKVGDMMSPADGKTQVSTKEGGLFELSPNDDLIAAPGAAGRMNQKGERGGGARRDAALIAKIEQLISVNKAILAKSPVIEMSGNEVGQGINQAEREIQ